MKTLRKFMAEVKSPVVKEDLAPINKKSIQAQGVPVKSDDNVADKVFRQWTGTYFGEAVEPENLQETRRPTYKVGSNEPGDMEVHVKPSKKLVDGKPGYRVHDVGRIVADDVKKGEHFNKNDLRSLGKMGYEIVHLKEGKSISARLNFKKQGDYPKDSELKHVGYDPKKDQLHINVNKNWTKASPEVFRSWSGNRRVNGKKHTGPRFYWLTNKEVGKD